MKLTRVLTEKIIRIIFKKILDGHKKIWQSHIMKTKDKFAQAESLIPEITKLFKQLKKQIRDDYRASGDDDNDIPGMQVTIGFTPAKEFNPLYPNENLNDFSWHYQTGDNSYSGGAYGHRNWGVVSLYRRSNSRELAKDAINQICEAMV